MEEKFLKTEDDVLIAINHYKSQKNAVIIICPGWFMTKDAKLFSSLSNDLLKYFDVITMDFRGHGKSHGFYTFMSKEEFDLKAVVEYAKAENYDKIYLLGFSLGGGLVLIHGAKQQDISKIIAVSAPTDFYKIENRIYSPDAWIPTLFHKFEPFRWLSIRAGYPFFKKEKPITLADKILVPTLFIAGEKDPTVCSWHNQALFDKAKCKKDMKLFKNTRHAEDLYHDYPKEFIKICVEWFNS